MHSGLDRYWYTRHKLNQQELFSLLGDNTAASNFFFTSETGVAFLNRVIETVLHLENTPSEVMRRPLLTTEDVLCNLDKFESQLENGISIAKDKMLRELGEFYEVNMDTLGSNEWQQIAT